MAMGKRRSEQAPMWIPTTDLPVSPGHPFYAGALGRGRAAQRADRRDRRDDAGGERRNAQYRAARHRRELPGIPDPARRCVGHQDADARGLGAAGPRRKKRTSNKDWENPSDPDAKITKMKDGRTHLAHKAEHAVDLDSGALVAVTLHGADVGDTTSLIETAIAAAEQVEAAHATSPPSAELTEIVADKGYHSNQTLLDLTAVAVRSYIAEPDRGRRDWTTMPEAQSPVYRNRRRVRGVRGKRLLRRRGEYVERTFAHVYDTGGLRRTHLRGHQNILKRLLVHAGAFNLGLLMRTVIGVGTPRGLQGRLATLLQTLRALIESCRGCAWAIAAIERLSL